MVPYAVLTVQQSLCETQLASANDWYVLLRMDVYEGPRYGFMIIPKTSSRPCTLLRQAEPRLRPKVTSTIASLAHPTARRVVQQGDRGFHTRLTHRQKIKTNPRSVASASSTAMVPFLPACPNMSIFCRDAVGLGFDYCLHAYHMQPVVAPESSLHSQGT
jgi:hypothetical protein